MSNYVHHQEKIDQKLVQKWRHYVRLRGLITVIILWLMWYFIYKNEYFLASASFISAALVVSLPNYVSSFFSYIYITSTAQFEEWDIIKTWNPFMSVFGEVLRIWLFFTTIKEVDQEMLFTWRTISFANNLILTWWIFNYTRNDLLFWHEFTILLGVKEWESANVAFQNLRTIIMKEYYKSLTDNDYYQDSKARDSNPKFDLRITEKWLECKIKYLVHFYKLLDTNNSLNLLLLDEHKKWTIYLISHKDYNFIKEV